MNIIISKCFSINWCILLKYSSVCHDIYEKNKQLLQKWKDLIDSSGISSEKQNIKWVNERKGDTFGQIRNTNN